MFRASNQNDGVNTPLTPIVAVPVRDESERLPELLKALGAQSWIASTGNWLPVVLVFNNCRDASAQIARSVASKLPQLRIFPVEVEFPPDQAHVGSARRLAMEIAHREAGSGGILLSTDADAVPDPDWIKATLHAMRQGADLVGGLIIGDPTEERLLGPGFIRRAARHLRYAGLVDQLTATLDPTAYDPWPRHSDHTGASLAVRAEVYAQVGGIPAIPCREDVTFVENALRAGFRLRHAPEVRVKVSARLKGRAMGGMADCIQGWVRAEELGMPHLVEDPAILLEKLIRRRRGPIVFRPQLDEGVPSNAPAVARDKGRQIDVDTAIARLERMIALSGVADVA